MKSQEEVIKFIEKQMRGPEDYGNYYERKHQKIHYGWIELGDLVKFIYGDKG